MPESEEPGEDECVTDDECDGRVQEVECPADGDGAEAESDDECSEGRMVCEPL